MIFIKNLKKETKFKFLRFLFFSICVIMNLCLLTDAKSNYNYYNINLPKKVNGIESVQYYINDAPCGSTDGVNSIKLKQDTKLKFSVKFEENKYNKLKFKDLKLKQNNNIIKFNLYKKDENNNIILYEPDQNEYINTNQEYVSSEINIDSDCNFYFNKLKQDIYNIKIKSNLDNINNINLKYRIINQENINNYGDFKTDYIYDYNLNMFKIPDLTPDCTLELIITPDSSYSKSNFNVFYNNKKINSNNNIFKITEINSDGEILIDNLEKNKYTINSSTEKINVKNIVLNHGDSYEFNCVNNTPDDCYVTVNNIIVKPDQNNMYKIHNITEDLNINFTKKSDAEHRIYFDKILKYYNITDINNNSINYLNVKDNQEARFNLTPKPDYSDNIITNEIFSEIMYDFDNNSHKISFDSGNYVIKNVTSSLNLYSNDVPKNKYFVKIVGNLSNLSFYNLVVNNTKIFDHTKEIIVEYGDTVDLNFDVIDGYDCSDSYVTTHPALESITGSDGSFILNNINSNLYINIHNIKKIINEDVITVKSTPVMDYTSFYQDYYNTYYADKNVREEIFENSLVNQFSNLFNNSLNFDIFKPVSKLENITDSDVQKAQELYENSEEYQEFLQKQEELKLEEKTEPKEDSTEKETEQEASTQNSESDINNEKVASAAEVAYADDDPNDMNWENFANNNYGLCPRDVFDYYHIRDYSNNWWHGSISDAIGNGRLERMNDWGSDRAGEGGKDHYVRTKSWQADYLIVPKYGYALSYINLYRDNSWTVGDDYWNGVKMNSDGKYNSNLHADLKEAWILPGIKNNDYVYTAVTNYRMIFEVDQSVEDAYGTKKCEELFEVYHLKNTNLNGNWYGFSSFAENSTKGNLELCKYDINGADTVGLGSDTSNDAVYVVVPINGNQLTFERGSHGDIKAESIYDHVYDGTCVRRDVGTGFEYAWEMTQVTNNDIIKVSVRSVNFNMNPSKDTDGMKATDLLKLYHIKGQAGEWYKNALNIDEKNANGGINKGLLEMKMYPNNNTQKALLFGAYPYEDYVIVPQKGYRFEVSGNNAQKVTDKYTGVHGDFANAYIVHNLQNDNTIDITLHNVKWSTYIDNLFDVYYLRNWKANANSKENDWYTKKVSELETTDVNSEYGMYKRPNLNGNLSTALMPNYDDGMVYVLVPKEINSEIKEVFFLSSDTVNLKHISVQDGVDMTKITDPRLKNAWIMMDVGHNDEVKVDTNVFKVNVDVIATLMEKSEVSCWIDKVYYTAGNPPSDTPTYNEGEGYTRTSCPNVMAYTNLGTHSETTDGKTTYTYYPNATFYLPKETGTTQGFRFTTTYAKNNDDLHNKIWISNPTFSGRRYLNSGSDAAFDLFNLDNNNNAYCYDDINIKLYGSPPETINAKLDIEGTEMEFKDSGLEYGANYACFNWSQTELDNFVLNALTSSKIVPNDLFYHRIEENFNNSSNYYDTNTFNFTISPLSKTFWQANKLILKCGNQEIVNLDYDGSSWPSSDSSVIMDVSGPSNGVNTMTIKINKGEYLKYIGEQIKSGQNYNDYKDLKLVFVYGKCEKPDDNSKKYIQIRYTSNTMLNDPKIITKATIKPDFTSITINETADLQSFYTTNYELETTNFIDSVNDNDLFNNKIYILISAKQNYQRNDLNYVFNQGGIEVKYSKTDSNDSGNMSIIQNEQSLEGMLLEINPGELEYWTILDISNIWLDMKSIDLIFESSPGTEFYKNGICICNSNGEYNTGILGFNYTEKELDQIGYVSDKTVQSLGFKNNLEKLSLGKKIKSDSLTKFGTVDGSEIKMDSVKVGTIDSSGIVKDVDGNIVGKKNNNNIIVNMDGQEIGVVKNNTIELYEATYTDEALSFLIAKSDDRYTDNFKIMLTDLNGNSVSQKNIYNVDTDNTELDISNDFKNQNLRGYDDETGTFNLFNILPNNSEVLKDDNLEKYYYDGVYYNYDNNLDKDRKFYFNDKQMVGAELKFDKSLYLRVIRDRISTLVNFQTDHEGIQIVDSQNNEKIFNSKECIGATLSFNIIPDEGYEMPVDIQVYLENLGGELQSVSEINGRYVLVEPEYGSTVILKYTPVKKEYDVFFTQYDGVEYKDKANINTYTGSTKAKHGEDFSFCVNLDRLSAYSDVEPNSLKVTVASETYNTELDYITKDTEPYLSKDGNIYTIHNVNDNYRILVDGLEVNKYTVTFKERDGIVYMDQYGLKELENNITENIEEGKTKIEVVHDDSIGFKVVPIEDSGIDENSIVVWAVSKQNGIDVTNRLYKSGDGTYFINNIMTDYEVYIEDVKKTTHVINFRPAEGVTYLSSTGEVINSDVTVSYGEDLEFSVLIADDYNKSEPKVYIKGIDTPLTKTGDNKYILEDIKEDKTIEVLNVTKNTYTVSFENTEGVEYKTIKNKKIEDSIEAEYDGSFQFKITLLDAYDKSVPSVILNGTEPLAESNGVYTINKITGDVKITVENITKNPEELTMEDILSIPDPVNSEADVNQVISATKSYDNLSEEDKLFVTNSGVLEKAQEASKDINHNSDGISVTGVDWNLKLVVTDLNHDEEAKEDLNSEIDRKELISLYDIKLINLMTNEEHEVPYGQEISVTIPKVKTDGYENIVVVHENSAGGIEYLDADVGTDTILFKTKSFSKFGVAGKKIPNYTENPSDMSMSVAGLVEDEEELKTLLGDNLSSQLGELINLDTPLDNSTDSTLSSTKKHSSNSPLAEYDDTWFVKLYKWAVNNELLAVLIVLLFGVIIILLMILLGRKKNNSDN